MTEGEGVRFDLANINEEVLSMLEYGSVDQELSDMSRHDEYEAGTKLVKLLCS